MLPNQLSINCDIVVNCDFCSLAPRKYDNRMLLIIYFVYDCRFKLSSNTLAFLLCRVLCLITFNELKPPHDKIQTIHD